jgi:hypothetical protein
MWVELWRMETPKTRPEIKESSFWMCMSLSKVPLTANMEGRNGNSPTCTEVSHTTRVIWHPLSHIEFANFWIKSIGASSSFVEQRIRMGPISWTLLLSAILSCWNLRKEDHNWTDFSMWWCWTAKAHSQLMLQPNSGFLWSSRCSDFLLSQNRVGTLLPSDGQKQRQIPKD